MAPVCAILTPMRPRHALLLPVLLALARRRPGYARSRDSSSRSRTMPTARSRKRGPDRIAAQLSTPCRADLKSKKIMVVIGEVQSNGYIAAQQQNYGPHFQAINARLRSLGLAHVHAGGDPRADRAGRDRRLFQERSGRRAERVEAARRELRAARPHLGAGDAQSDDERQPGVGEHGVHALRQRRPDHLRPSTRARARTPARTWRRWR